jgi:monoamine oxidase
MKTKHDVVVVGAGLAGMTAARDLTAGGADVIVLEAAGRAGGRVKVGATRAGKSVELGGEQIGEANEYYLELAAELGLPLVESPARIPGDCAFDAIDGVSWGESPAGFTAADRATWNVIQSEFNALAASMDSSDVTSLASWRELDSIPLTKWYQERSASHTALRYLESIHLALAGGCPSRLSALGQLWDANVMGAQPDGTHLDAAAFTLKGGSSSLPRALANILGEQIRYESGVRGVQLASGGCTVELVSGQTFLAENVLFAVPIPVLAAMNVEGVSTRRLASWKSTRYASAAKVVMAFDEPFWEKEGLCGTSLSEGILGGTWPQSHSVLSALIPPERLGVLSTIEPTQLHAVVAEELSRIFGLKVPDFELFVERWADKPHVKAYSHQWWPGDLQRLAETHGQHEPPLYVCGADHWATGYMEGAIRTARRAARSILSDREEKERSRG